VVICKFSGLVIKLVYWCEDYFADTLRLSEPQALPWLRRLLASHFVWNLCWTKWRWDRNFAWYNRCYEHHSTSAPSSYVIQLVLTVYNLSNCQRHRNICPSLGEDAKNYGVVFKTAEAVTCTSHVINWARMFRPSGCKLPAAAIRYYWQDETSPLPYFFRTVSLTGTFWRHTEETCQDSYIVPESAEPCRIRRHP